MEPLAVPVVALTRSQVSGPPVVARPVDVEMISRAAVYPDLLSRWVMKSVDPGVGRGDQMSLRITPDVDGNAWHTERREMVLDEIVMEKFVLVPEVCPVGSMTSAAVAVANPLAVVDSDTARVSALPVVGGKVPAVYVGKVALDSVGLRVDPSCIRLDPEETLPAFLDERSVFSCVDLGVTPDGGPVEGEPVLSIRFRKRPWTVDLWGGMTVLEPLEHSVLEIAPGDGLRMNLSIVFDPLKHSVLQEALDVQPMRVQSGLGQLEYSVPDVAPFWGDCLVIRMTVSDSFEQSGLDVTDSIDLDGGHLDCSAWIRGLDDRPMAGITVLEPIEHSVLDVDMDSLWMAPWDAGGTFRIGSRLELAVRRDILCCDVQSSRRPVFPAVGYMGYVGGLARTCVIDLYAGVSTTPIEMLVEDDQPDFPRLQFPPVCVEVWPSTSVALASEDSRGRGCVWHGYSPDDSSMPDLGLPRVSCSMVEMCAVELNFPGRDFRRVSFARKDGTYKAASLTGSPVHTRTVTG